jgi:hypothetical protein
MMQKRVQSANTNRIEMQPLRWKISIKIMTDSFSKSKTFNLGLENIEESSVSVIKTNHDPS